jgi:uncharacterized protein
VYAQAAVLRYVLRMPASTCPTCKGTSAPYPGNPAHPFCCQRCKLADLSNWFNERYAVASEPGLGEREDDGGEDPPLLH